MVATYEEKPIFCSSLFLCALKFFSRPLNIDDPGQVYILRRAFRSYLSTSAYLLLLKVVELSITGDDIFARTSLLQMSCVSKLFQSWHRSALPRCLAYSVLS